MGCLVWQTTLDPTRETDADETTRWMPHSPPTPTSQPACEQETNVTRRTPDGNTEIPSQDYLPVVWQTR